MNADSVPPAPAPAPPLAAPPRSGWAMLCRGREREYTNPPVATPSKPLFAHVNWRRITVVVIYTAIFTVAWLTFFSLASLIPHQWRPEVDTITLPRVETFVFGRFHGAAMRKHLALDLLASVAYTFHFLVPFVFLALAIAAHRHEPHAHARPLSFAGALVIASFVANISQILIPTAPPWYNEREGHAPANYKMHGNAGGLARIDEAYNKTYFFQMYDQTPIVFGSFPSMHTMWPILVLMYQWTNVGRALSLAHIGWIAWSAVYLHHHFLLDVIGAYVYVLFGIWLSRLLWLVVGRFFGGADGLFGLFCPSYYSDPQLRMEAENGANGRFATALCAILLFRGCTPFSAPDVFWPSMPASARAIWAPDLGDGGITMIGDAKRQSMNV